MKCINETIAIESREYQLKEITHGVKRYWNKVIPRIEALNAYLEASRGCSRQNWKDSTACVRPNWHIKIE